MLADGQNVDVFSYSGYVIKNFTFHIEQHDQENICKIVVSHLKLNHCISRVPKTEIPYMPSCHILGSLNVFGSWITHPFKCMCLVASGLKTTMV